MVRTLLTITTLVAMAASAPAGCGALGSSNGGSGGGGPIKVCDINSDPPEVGIAHGAATIVTTSYAACDITPISHVVQLSIEWELPGGAWGALVSPQGGYFSHCTELPTPGHTTVCVWYVDCEDGHYRTRTLVTGTMVQPDGTARDFAFDDDRRPERTIKCPKVRR